MSDATQEITILREPPEPLVVYRPPPPAEVVQRMHRELNLPMPLCIALAQRGLIEKEQVRRYLVPDARRRDEKHLPLPALHDPFRMADMRRAVDLLIEAKVAGTRILVHGDYDVDGVTSTALLARVLTRWGFDVVAAVPNRHVDGYGLSARLAERALAEGISFILTCDVGISETEKIADLASRGVTVIVTDHHHVPEDGNGVQILPGAAAVINPHRDDCEYPFKDLAGVGVAFHLLLALAREMDIDEVQELYPYLDLVALGTVADIVALTDVNRALVSLGLASFRDTENLGLRALLEVAGVPASRVNETTCGFVLGPRINAIGRLDDAGIALRMFLSEDPAEAGDLAQVLDRANIERKAITEKIEMDAIRQVEAIEDLDSRSALALFAPDWHHGIVGIVASRIVERYGRPVFMFAPDDTGAWKGSGRAPESERIHLYEILADCRDHLRSFGGHAAAAGAALTDGEPATAEAFAHAFDRAAGKRMLPEDRIPKLLVDFDLDLASIDTTLWKFLRMCAPFGEKNNSLLFIARDVEILAAKETADGKHVRLPKVRQAGSDVFSAIGFRLRDRIPALVETPAPYFADLAFRIDENVFNGRVSLQLMLEYAWVKVDKEGYVAEGELCLSGTR